MGWRDELKQLQEKPLSNQSSTDGGDPIGKDFKSNTYIHPEWNSEKIYQSLIRGESVHIWSDNLREWVTWKLEEDSIVQPKQDSSNLVTYSLSELNAMITDKVTVKGLKMIHSTKKILGGRVIKSKK